MMEERICMFVRRVQNVELEIVLMSDDFEFVIQKN